MPRKKVIIDCAHVMQLKLEGVKKLCAKHKLSKKGRKAELQKRILQHLKLDTTIGEADKDATSSKDIEATVTDNQAHENVMEDSNAKERTNQQVKHILQDGREEMDECSKREQRKVSEGTLKELLYQSEKDLEALKSVKDESKSSGEEKVKKQEKTDGSFEELEELDECFRREQPKLSHEATFEKLPNQSEEDLEALKKAENEGKSFGGGEHLKSVDQGHGSSEKPQKRSIAEAGLLGDSKSSKKPKITISTSSNDQNCISTNLDAQKNIGQAKSSHLVDDLDMEKLDAIDKKHSNAPLRDIKQSVTLGRTKDDIARYLISLETGELVSLCTKLCATDNKLFRVLSKPE